MSEPKRYPNKLGVVGWALGGRWGFERYLYTLHRLTGLGLLFYFTLHVFVTSTRAFSPDAWRATMEFMENPFFEIGEFLIYLAFAYHAMNGIRLIIIEMFGAVGRPIEPIYPYKTSLHRTRPLMVILMLICVILIAVGTYDFFALTSH